MIRFLLILAGATLASAPLAAQVRPQPEPGGDPRIQSVTYVPDQVVLIEGSPGYHITLELSPDDRHAIRARIRAMNDLGFAVDEITLEPMPGGSGAVRLRVAVANRRFHVRKLERLTGIVALEGQARLLLNDLEEYKAWIEYHEARQLTDQEAADTARRNLQNRIATGRREGRPAPRQMSGDEARAWSDRNQSRCPCLIPRRGLFRSSSHTQAARPGSERLTRSAPTTA